MIFSFVYICNDILKVFLFSSIEIKYKKKICKLTTCFKENTMQQLLKENNYKLIIYVLFIKKVNLNVNFYFFLCNEIMQLVLLYYKKK